MKTLLLAITSSIFTFAIVACDNSNSASTKANPKGPMKTSEKAPEEPNDKVVKTDAEWKKILTPEQYRVARQAGTEMANNATYKQFKKQGAGTYYCVGCDAKLFSSKEKFDARCGWPSFYDPAKAENVTTKTDYSGGMIRKEVICSKCDAHLGHVFHGEGFNTPTNKRYCINGIVLKFVPDKEGEEGGEVNKTEASE